MNKLTNLDHQLASQKYFIDTRAYDEIFVGFHYMNKSLLSRQVNIRYRRLLIIQKHPWPMTDRELGIVAEALGIKPGLLRETLAILKIRYYSYYVCCLPQEYDYIFYMACGIIIGLLIFCIVFPK
jgi:hypothetical protein